MRIKLESGVVSALFLVWVTIVLASCGPGIFQQSAANRGVNTGESEKVFRHRWWNYYERAVSRMNNGLDQEAEADLVIALSKRSMDGRRARTYGMHFTDYFPHRELGVLYLRQGKLDAAEQELLLSIKQYPSAKASFYLNRVRQKKIRTGGLDTAPPRIAIEDEEVFRKPTNAFSLDLSGKIVDDRFVSGLSIQGNPYRIEQVSAEVSFRQTVNLSPGINTIEILAQDLAGNQTRRQLQVIVDRQGPQISVDKIKLAKERKKGMYLLTIAGVAWDKQPIKSMSIAGHQVHVEPETGVFLSEFRVPASTESVEFLAEDAVGNQVSGTIEVAVSPVGRLAKVGQPVILLATADLLVMSDMETPWIQLAKSGEGQPPHIHVKAMDTTQEVFWDRVFLEGRVVDDTKVTRVNVNGMPVLRRPGRQVFFSYLLPLKVGKNTIVIYSEDEANNISVQKLQIIRKQQKVKKLGQRLKISMLPLGKKGAVGFITEAVEDNLFNALVKQKRFQLVERSRLKAILGELKLSGSKLVDPATAARVGKISAASMVMMGSIIEMKDGVEVIVWIVDAETSEIIATQDVYDDNKSLDSLQMLMEGLANKLDHVFPLLQGLLIQRDGKRILIDVGEASGLRRGMRLMSFRKSNPIIHPLTGKVLGVDTVITGELKITEVAEDFSHCELLSETEAGSVQQMDAVITR